MRRLTLGLAALAGMVAAGPAWGAQAPSATQLWRVASQTLPRPPALVDGTAAVFWNPAAGALEPTRLAVGIELINGAAATGVGGVLAAARARVGAIGQLGVVLGRMAIGDLVRTSTSPAPEPGAIAFHSLVYGLGWSAAPAGSAVRIGVLGLAHSAALDETVERGWTLDAGVRYQPGRRLVLAAATHFLSRRLVSDAQQDVFGAAAWEAWRGRLGRAPAAATVRIGLAGAHGGGVDEFFGVGLAFGDRFELDGLLAREDRYGNSAIRAVVGIRLSTARYRVALARDGGINDLGAALRFGLEMVVR